MAVVTTNLGAVTAYADAVAGGYTGTKAEWQALMASYGSVAEQAAESASQAADSASAASTKASEATTAAATATSAKTDAVAANTAAQSAKTAAQTAQAGAETAAASVQSSAAQIQTNADDISELKEELTDKADTVDMLKAFPTDTASGAVASFADGANVPVKSLIVNIDPVQSGSGDPSPTNVRPISGWSVVNVGVSGKNLFDSNFSDYTKPYDYYIRPIKLESDKRYVIKAELVGTVVTGAVFGITKKGDKYSEFAPYVVVASSGTVASFEFTVDGTFTSPKLIVYASGQAKFDEVMSNYNITLEVKADQNPYEPYKGTFHTIPLGQTVYGGKLDVLSGELVIDRAMVVLNGAETWIKDTDSTSNDGICCFRAYIECSSLKKPHGTADTRTYVGVMTSDIMPTLKNGYVNQYKISDTLMGVTGYSGDKGNYIYIIVNTNRSDVQNVSLLKSWLSENPTTICYELATPLTVTLTPNELSTLLGANNIWSDAGEVTAEYRADPTLYIQRLTEPDADMIADANITSGQYFMVGNTLYKATANIASGANIVPNVNCTRKSLSEALNELNA